MEFLAIIQARLGSTRLPSKVLMDLGGKTVLENVVERVLKSTQISDLFVATTVNKEDLKIVSLCAEKNIRVFCGSANDVLDRFYQLAKLVEPQHIVRITADCPLMDPLVIDQIIAAHLSKGNDYTSNTLEESYPDGEDVEVFKFESLKRAWNEASLASEREHVTPYIKKHPEIFQTQNITYPENLSSKRWTLDKVEDYEFIKRIYSHFAGTNKIFGMQDILKFLKSNPGLENLNSHIARNEGYQKSLKEDKIIQHKEGE